MNKIFFIIGASGSGKTTTLGALEQNKPSHYKVLYFDSIGVPSSKEMVDKYNSPENWQRIKTIEWVKTIKEEFLNYSHVLLDGQTRPQFVIDACLQNEIIDYEIILFDCSNKERKKRLENRGQAELADQNMMNWASYLRKECEQRGYQMINNNSLTLEQTLAELLKLIN